VRIAAFNHVPDTFDFVVPAGDSVSLRLTLTSRAVTLEPILTRAAKTRQRDQFESTPDVGTFSLSNSAVTSVPAVGEADVLRVVQMLPGVLSRNDFDAGYNVRGGESDQNLILLDGTPVYNPFHLGGLFGTFIPAAVDRADLLAGGFGAQHGGRLSSVLDVVSHEEGRKGVHGTAGVSLLASSLTLGGSARGGTTSWNVAARRTYADMIASAIRNEDLPYHFQDFQGHVLNQLGGGGTLALTAYAGRDVLDGNFSGTSDSSRIGGGDIRFDWGNALAGLTWEQPVHGFVTDSSTLVQHAAITHFSTGLDLGSGSLRLTNTVRDLRLAGSMSFAAGQHTPTAGYEITQHHVVYDIRSEQISADLFSLDQSITSVAGYAEDLWSLTPKLLARAGVRAEHMGAADWTGISPRASLRYFATPDLAITIAGGQYAQWMHAIRNEDLPIRIFDFWVAADSVIPVSTARHLVIGAERWFSDRRFVRIEGFYKKYSDLLEPDPLDDPVIRGDEFRNVDGRSYGVDLLVRQLELGPLSGWISYTYAVSRREKDGEFFAPAQDRRHNLNIVASYRTPGDYEWSLRLGVGTGTPFTPIESEIVRRMYDPVTGTWNPAGAEREVDAVGGARNSERYPVYHRLDLGVSRRFVKERATIVPYLQVVNAYNQRNVWIYRFDYEDQPPTREAISQFPILPTIGVTVEF
jgi:hypothetical protein